MTSYISLLAIFTVLAACALPTCNASVDCLSFPHKRRMYVKTELQLDHALVRASAGDLILLEPGHYKSVVRGGNFHHIWMENKHGTKDAPITLCGPRTAYIDSEGPNGPIVMVVSKSSYINIAGITIQNGLKGIVFETVTHSTINNVMVRNTGLEGIHIQYKSSYNIIINSTIIDTGRQKPGNGEGIYLGSDDSRGVDPCTHNHVLYNHIGPGVTAEMVDVKQYSSNAIIKGNVLDGRDLCGCNYAVSLIDVKGNGYKIIGNIGKNAREDMFKVATTNAGQGNNNYFSGNKCLTQRSGHYCVKIPNHDTRVNTVSCNQHTNERCFG